MEKVAATLRLEAFSNRNDSTPISTKNNFLSIHPKRITVQKNESIYELTYEHVQFNYTSYTVNRNQPFILGLRLGDDAVIKFSDEISIKARKPDKKTKTVKTNQPSSARPTQLHSNNKKRKRNGTPIRFHKRQRATELQNTATQSVSVQTQSQESIYSEQLQYTNRLLEQRSSFFQSVETFANNTMSMCQIFATHLTEFQKKLIELQSEINSLKQDNSFSNEPSKPSREPSYSQEESQLTEGELFLPEINIPSPSPSQEWCNFFQERQQSSPEPECDLFDTKNTSSTIK